MKVGKLILEFFILVIIGMFVNILYNIIDRVFIGYILDIGVLVMGGVGIVMLLMLIILVFGMLVGIGIVIKVFIKFGENDKEGVEKFLGNVFVLLIIISICLIILGFIFIDCFLIMFGVSDNILIYGREFI